METGIAKTLLLGKARASLILPFVADALSMPAHWIYKQPEIKQKFGYITDYQNSPTTNTTCFMKVVPIKTKKTSKETIVTGTVILKG